MSFHSLVAGREPLSWAYPTLLLNRELRSYQEFFLQMVASSFEAPVSLFDVALQEGTEDSAMISQLAPPELERKAPRGWNPALPTLGLKFGCCSKG